MMIFTQQNTSQPETVRTWLMRIFPIILLTALFMVQLTYAGDATRVYITRDAQGNPVFTDQPSKGAEVRDIQPLATVPALPIPMNAKTPDTTEPQTSYRLLNILSPLEQENVPVGLADQLIIKLALEPSLAKGHILQIKDRGRVIRSGTSLQYPLGSLDRGQHSLSAEVVDEENSILVSSPVRTIYIQRPRSH